MSENTLEMSHQEWLENRRKGIGGSDVGAILGLNKWRSPYQLWLDKTGQLPVTEDETNEFAYWGNVLEDVVAKEFARRTGKKVRRANQVFEHKDYPFLRANVDRMIVGEDAILECKTTSEWNSKEWEDDEIPVSYLLQVQHYLNVLDKDKGYIAALIGGNKFVWKEVKRDQELIDIMQAKLVDFWEKNVLGNVAPEIDGSATTTSFINDYYNAAYSDNTIELDIDELASEIAETKAVIKQLQEQVNEQENKIKYQLGEGKADVGISNQWIVTWKQVTTNRVDSKKLKADYPEIYEQCIKQSTSKRFNLKGVK